MNTDSDPQKAEAGSRAKALSDPSTGQGSQVPSGPRPGKALLTDIESEIEKALEPIVGKDKSGLVVQRIETVLATELFTGPLPPPAVLHGYEAIQAGFADRIVRMAEFEQQQRNHRATAQLSAEIRSHRDGLLMGFAIAISLIGGAIFLALHDQIVVACTLVGAAAVAMVPAFIGSVRHLNKRDMPPSKNTPSPQGGLPAKRRSGKRK